jgi:polyphosphate kinase
MAATKRLNKAKKAENERASKGQDELGGKDYERELARLHGELVKLQLWVVAKGLKVVIVFEGRDGAGKGGVIKAITERVSPRVYRVVALPAPTEREKSQMYVQRYMRHLPAAGEIVIFDRSWYNRAGVERVMEFCSLEQVKRFLELTPAVEKAFIESGIILIKYWLEVSEEEQTRRLEGRIDDPRKVWKLSPMDLKSYSRWYDYSLARAGRHVQGHRHGLGTVARRALRRQAARSSERHFPPPGASLLREAAARQTDIAEEAESSRLRRIQLPLQVFTRTRLARGLSEATLGSAWRRPWPPPRGSTRRMREPQPFRASPRGTQARCARGTSAIYSRHR